MSWTATLPKPLAADEIEEEAFNLSAHLDQEARQQFVLAVAKAKSIASSGAVGDKSKRFHVNLNGHANPGHEPADGWSNDAVSVSVAQAS